MPHIKYDVDDTEMSVFTHVAVWKLKTFKIGWMRIHTEKISMKLYRVWRIGQRNSASHVTWITILFRWLGSWKSFFLTYPPSLLNTFEVFPFSPLSTSMAVLLQSLSFIPNEIVFYVFPELMNLPEYSFWFFWVQLNIFSNYKIIFALFFVIWTGLY